MTCHGSSIERFWSTGCGLINSSPVMRLGHVEDWTEARRFQGKEAESDELCTKYNILCECGLVTDESIFR
jgi:hypothetical protein